MLNTKQAKSTSVSAADLSIADSVGKWHASYYRFLSEIAERPEVASEFVYSEETNNIFAADKTGASHAQLASESSQRLQEIQIVQNAKIISLLKIIAAKK